MLMSSNCVCSRSFLSSAASGSSSSSSFGRLTSARASATRWRWPPESWCGLRAPKPLIFTISRISPTWRRISSRPYALLLETEGDVLLHAHVRKERVRLEHHVHRPLVGRHRCSCPRRRSGCCRRSGSRSPASMRSSVVLPEPGAAQQAEDLAAADVERHGVDRGEVAELLGDARDAHVGAVGIGGASARAAVAEARVHETSS